MCVCVKGSGVRCSKGGCACVCMMSISGYKLSVSRYRSLPSAHTDTHHILWHGVSVCVIRISLFLGWGVRLSTICLAFVKLYLIKIGY